MKVDLPDDISEALAGSWPDLQRHALEAIAVEGYRTGALTEFQLQRMLELESRFDVHAFLKDRRVALRYTEQDVEDDLEAHRDAGVLPEE